MHDYKSVAKNGGKFGDKNFFKRTLTEETMEHKQMKMLASGWKWEKLGMPGIEC